MPEHCSLPHSVRAAVCLDRHAHCLHNQTNTTHHQQQHHHHLLLLLSSSPPPSLSHLTHPNHLPAHHHHQTPAEVGALWTPVKDVFVTMQLKFKQTFQSKNVEVPQIPFIVVCSCFQLCCSDEYAQCKLCNNRRFHSAVLGEVDVPVVMQRLVPMVHTVQFSGWFFSGVDFLEPSMTHSCELSRARGVPESPGVFLPGDSAPVLCQLALVTCSGHTLVSSLTSVRNNNNNRRLTQACPFLVWFPFKSDLSWRHDEC